ncbi:Protein At-4/1 [Quillaja saponaria]|uniref:Protein At-4/1 n=1 Tax=Quillaja saponaria TaxID=32244 RepID=A0AAD7LDR1_QUISA|nr:Protein At-4/1 [Quillaja saponaria]
MAAASDEEMNSLLSVFDQIYEDVKSGITEIQLLQSNYNSDIKKREALELTCNSLKQDNDRLAKLYTESLNNLADQLECRSKCQNLKEELKRVTDQLLRKENEYRNDMELLKEDCAAKIKNLEAQVKDFLLEKATYEATVSHLHQDLAAHKVHTQILTNRLDQVHFDVDSKYIFEIQDLKDCLLIEQEQKNELNKKVQHLEKELLISRAKLVEQQQDTTSSWHVETLKQKMMKLRKENEILKRKLSHSQEG